MATTGSSSNTAPAAGSPTLRFLGAARTVTGSRFLIETARAHDPQWADDVAAAWHGTLAFGVEYMRQRY